MQSNKTIHMISLYMYSNIKYYENKLFLGNIKKYK